MFPIGFSGCFPVDGPWLGLPPYLMVPVLGSKVSGFPMIIGYLHSLLSPRIKSSIAMKHSRKDGLVTSYAIGGENWKVSSATLYTNKV